MGRCVGTQICRTRRDPRIDSTMHRGAQESRYVEVERSIVTSPCVLHVMRWSRAACCSVLCARCADKGLLLSALDLPFLLLPFRPASDPSAVRTFIRHFFDQNMRGEVLAQELRMTEPMVCCGRLRWAVFPYNRLTIHVGYFGNREMVLEQATGWRCWLGCLRTIQSWRARFVAFLDRRFGRRPKPLPWYEKTNTEFCRFQSGPRFLQDVYSP